MSELDALTSSSEGAPGTNGHKNNAAVVPAGGWNASTTVFLFCKCRRYFESVYKIRLYNLKSLHNQLHVS